ncbi:MAG: DUF305 domain-containing protein [Acidobacteriota bacterium]
MTSRRLAVAVAALLALPAVQAAAQEEPPPPIIKPGAPGQPSTVIEAAKATDLSKVGYTRADVEFMQGMIGHHAQAIEMVDLLKTRTASDDMRKLGQRIEISQRDEIRMMKEWLTARGQAVPDEHAHHMPGATLMPGMLTADEMAKLGAAKGVAFDRLFLELMIKHHMGAVAMVQQLFATEGAGQDGEIFAFASDVDADQAMEIRRMAIMLKELGR